MHPLDLLTTLTVALTIATALGYATHRAGLSPLVGYLLAGVLVGPNTPGPVVNRELASGMADLGVVLLMFGVGLHFRFEDLLAVRRVALPGGALQVLASAITGALAAAFLGWAWPACVVFGFSVSVASTVVLTRLLVDSSQLHTPLGRLAIGWSVVQDLVTILMLLLLPVLVGPSPVGSAGLALMLAFALVKLAFAVAVILVVGDRFIPWLLRLVAASRSRELFTLTILVVALGIAVGAANLFGISMALGAFLAGMVVGRSDFSVRAASEALPMRDAFAVLFFVAVGMLFEPGFVLEAPGTVTATLGVVMLANPVAVFVAMAVMGLSVRLGVSLALAFGHVGEFSFIVAALGRELGVLPAEATQALVAAAIGSISLSPLLFRLAGPLDRWLERHPRLIRWLCRRGGEGSAADERQGAAQVPASQHRAVVVGYGPVGRTVVQLLRANQIEPTIVELNLETVDRLRAEGRAAVYGDASHSQTLARAGIEHAGCLVLSASDLAGSEEAVRLARELNPRVRILARAAYLQKRRSLGKAGADAVFTEEAEVALAMTENILTELGATPEQIDRERERVRNELLGEGDASSG